MILGDVEETVTTVEIDEETFEEIIKVRGELGRSRSACGRRLLTLPGCRPIREAPPAAFATADE